ncbi:efflux RND transporter periplasmic adaptor subunit (plasmid) [Mycetohabitans rhizoxinica]|uniref:Efflux RND transporter periplasmic adaptor subunit n=2 Tax=Mycetohabitans rhizoxinica TaxID=412963 RepID=A0ABZ2PZU0_9BURK
MSGRRIGSLRPSPLAGVAVKALVLPSASRRRPRLAPCGTAIASVLSALMLLNACRDRAAPAAPARPVVAATVHSATVGAMAATTVPGEVAARFSTPLSFRVGGKLIERRVHLGDAVHAGQIVAQLDPADARKNAASAAAQLRAAEHRLLFARQQLERDRAQAQSNLISQLQLEQTEDNHAAALAQRDVAAQQAALAKDQLGYTTLVADHEGVITQELADTGQNLSAGQAVYQLAWSGARDVICDLPERTLAFIGLGAKASVTLAALPGQAFTATLRELAPCADPASRTYRAKLTLELPHGGADTVRLGMTARVAFQPDATRAALNHDIVLPATALFHQNERPAVWVIRANAASRDAGQPRDAHKQDVGTLELRPVTVSHYTKRSVVVSAGLTDGERVVLRGVHTVSAGEQVKPVAPLHPEDFAL